MDTPRKGELLKVVYGTPERQNAKWLEAGDVVEVVNVYPYNILVQKVKGVDGWHMRQSYPINSWKLDLERIGAR